jgi:hypothetical protein
MAETLKTEQEQSGNLLATEERRAWIRYHNDFPTEWQIYGKHQEGGFPAQVVDVSMAGIGLLLDHPCPAGAMLLVRVPAEVRPSGWVLTRVKHVVETPEKQFHAGCTFAVSLSAEQLQALLRHDATNDDGDDPLS